MPYGPSLSSETMIFLYEFEWMLYCVSLGMGTRTVSTLHRIKVEKLKISVKITNVQQQLFIRIQVAVFGVFSTNFNTIQGKLAIGEACKEPQIDSI